MIESLVTPDSGGVQVVSRARRILRGPTARAGKNTSGNYCHISGGVAGILAPPIRLQD